MTLKQIAAGAALLAASGLSHGLAFTGEYRMDAGFDTYSGTLGRQAQSPGNPLETYFSVNGGAPVQQLPTTAFATGPAAFDPNVGTGSVNLNEGITPPATSVSFYFGLFGDSSGLGFIKNTLDFGNPFITHVISVGRKIKLATLTINNGNWHIGDGVNVIPAEISFTVRAQLIGFSGVEETHIWRDTLLHTNRSVTGGSIQDNADLYSFTTFSSLGVLAVNDGGTGTIDIEGYIGSLIPTNFANPTGDLFIVQQQVPEPSPYALVLLGIALLAARSRGRTVE